MIAYLVTQDDGYESTECVCEACSEACDREKWEGWKRIGPVMLDGEWPTHCDHCGVMRADLTITDPNPWAATHEIRTPGHVYRVMAHETADGTALFSREEWDKAESCDWSLSTDGSLEFQGSVTSPMCDGAAIRSVR